MINLNPFVCGAFLDEEESEGAWGSPYSSSSPRSKSRRNSFCRRSHNSNKNPYSTRGLDKFSALLADLEAKRQKIYSQVGPDHISFVRFAYPDSNNCVPIVVKLKEKDHPNDDVNPKDRKWLKPQHFSAPLSGHPVAAAPLQAPATEKSDRNEVSKRRSLPWSGVSLERLRRPSYYVPAVVIMILLLLTVFGRSVAILCTSIAWYAVPTMTSDGNFSNPKKSTKKKELRRRLSETARHRMSSPRASSPEQHGCRKIG